MTWFLARPLRLALLLSAAALVANGCALGKKKVVSESLTTCRELSREGVSAMETGQWNRAQDLLSGAVAASPSDADARRNLGEALWQQGSHRDALVHMETAVQLDPRHVPTLVRSGEMLLMMGASEKAMTRAEEALRLDATLAGPWALRGRVYRQQGDLERALADLQQSLRFSPHDTGSLLEVAQIHYELGRPQRTLSTLHSLLDNYPPGGEPQQVLWLEGLAYDSLNRHQEAVESLAAASQRGAAPPQLLFQLAQAENAAGQREAATNTLRQALAVDGTHEPSRVMLAQLQQVSTGGETLLR